MRVQPPTPPLGMREKLLTHGAERLSDAELLATFISSGNANKSCLQLAHELMLQVGDLRQILHTDSHTFQSVKGLGLVRYTQLQAAKEICRRSDFISLQKDIKLTNAEQTGIFFKRQLRDKKNETLVALFLDSQYRVLSYEELFHGTIHTTQIHPRPIIEKILHLNAAAVIIAHNHPSGLSTASAQDVIMTQRLKDALTLIDVQLLDHLVIGDNEVYSISQQIRWACF